MNREKMMSEEEKLCIKFVNRISFYPISLSSFYDAFRWLDEEGLLNRFGESFVDTFERMFMELGEDED